MARYFRIYLFCGISSFARCGFLRHTHLWDSSAPVSWSVIYFDEYVWSTNANSVLRLPADIVRERYLTAQKHQLPFTQRTTLFQDLVVRCMRYSFSNIPSRITKVLFAKGVALPFLRFRMLRHGYFRQLLHPVWKEIHLVSQNIRLSDSSI